MSDRNIVVTFLGRYDDTEGWDNHVNLRHSITFADSDEQIEFLWMPNEIVIPMKKIRIKYNYPLLQEFIFNYETTNETGFTRAEIAHQIVDTYRAIINKSPHLLNTSEVDLTHTCAPNHVRNLYLYSMEQVEGNLFKLTVEIQRNLFPEFRLRKAPEVENHVGYKLSILIQS